MSEHKLDIGNLTIIMPNPENSRIDEIAKAQTDSQIEELRQEIEELKQENKELRRQLKSNSPSSPTNLKMDLRDI
jgi:ribosomal protein L29